MRTREKTENNRKGGLSFIFMLHIFSLFHILNLALSLILTLTFPFARSISLIVTLSLTYNLILTLSHPLSFSRSLSLIPTNEIDRVEMKMSVGKPKEHDNMRKYKNRKK